MVFTRTNIHSPPVGWNQQMKNEHQKEQRDRQISLCRQTELLAAEIGAVASLQGSKSKNSRTIFLSENFRPRMQNLRPKTLHFESGLITVAT